MPGHDHRRTYMLHLHGLNVYPGHWEELASGIVLPLHLASDLTLEVAPASAKASHWRAMARAFKIALNTDYRETWYRDSRMGRHSCGDSTAVSIAAAIGFEAATTLWTPYYPQAVTELRGKNVAIREPETD